MSGREVLLRGVKRSQERARIWFRIPERDWNISRPEAIRKHMMVYYAKEREYIDLLEEVGVSRRYHVFIIRMTSLNMWYDPMNSFRYGPHCFKKKYGRRFYFKSWKEIEQFLKKKKR